MRKANREIIGIMGGIGCGKSFVADLFQELGAKCINADKLAHRALEITHVQKQIAALWGEHLFAGAIDRQALANIVFCGSPQQARTKLKQLENIIHPIVRAQIEKMMDDYENQPSIVLDVPLLWEGGLYKRCSILIFVEVPLLIRQQRVRENRNWTAQQLAFRQNLQGSLDDKRSIAHYTVDNGQSRQHTQSQVKAIWEALLITRKPRPLGVVTVKGFYL